LSTSIVQNDFAPIWKQEVSRRVAAHRSRRGLSAPKPAASTQTRKGMGSRAALAASRVAARYAQAPSYSQMHAADAHAVQTAVQADLPGLQIVSDGLPRWEPEAEQAVAHVQTSAQDLKHTVVPAQPEVPATLEAWENTVHDSSREPDHSFRPLEPAPARAPRPVEEIAPVEEDRWERPSLAEEPWEVQAVGPVQPIHANLIEFPRELVAPRKRRPRRAEGPLAEGLERQLSIFEVDPGALPIQPELIAASPVWPSIVLEAQPQDEPELQSSPVSQLELEQAPINHRLLAAIVDGALIASAFLGSVLVAAANIEHPPAVKIVAYSAICALLLTGLFYQALFLILVKATPGMMYARVSLCTFDGQIPTRAQLRRRLGALLLSLLPVGLGIAWILFDDDRLCWHDRFSKTYLRQC